MLPDIPVIVESTIMKETDFSIGQAYSSLYLFKAVGKKISVTVEPKLPAGLVLNSDTGEVYGTPSEYADEKDYVFTVNSVPPTTPKTVTIRIKFNAVTCPADSGFPETVAQATGTQVIQSCGSSQSGTKIRYCLLINKEAQWGEIDDSECKLSSGVLVGIIIGSVALLIIIVIIIFYTVLRCGCFRKRATSKGGVRQAATFTSGNEVRI